MGTKGRPIFDLNELPPVQDDCDFPPSTEAEARDALGLQSSSGAENAAVTANLSRIVPPPLVHAVDVAPVLHTPFGPAARVQSVDVAPLPLGQHPLSCFRPFIRSNLKSMACEDSVRDVKEDSSLKRSPLDIQETAPVISSPSSTSTRNSSIQSGDIMGSRTGEDEGVVEMDVTMEDGEVGAGSKTLGGGHIKVESADVRSLKQEAPLESRDTVVDDSTAEVTGIMHACEASKDSKDAALISAGCQAQSEGHEHALLQSARKDGSVRDGLKGHQSFVEGKFSSSFGKRGRSDHKDAMLGKKRNRQTMFLDVREAARQAAPPKTPISKKNVSSPLLFRQPKETPRTPVAQPVVDKNWDSVTTRPKDQKISNPFSDGSKAGASSLLEVRNSSNANLEGPQQGTSEALKQCQMPVKKMGLSSSDTAVEVLSSASNKHISRKQGQGDDKSRLSQLSKTVGKHTGQGKMGADEKPANFLRPLAKKNLNNFRKQSTSGNLYHSQDSSIERLHREATCDKLWRSPGDAELQRVPDSFESVQEYVNVFEPLLFEECRAQLHSTWEELSDGLPKDPHIQVSVKIVEKRERGWFDLVLIPTDAQARLGFKEGDAAVISTPKPGSAGKMKRQSNGSGACDSPEAEFSSRTAGIVRRYMPVDTRDPHGAILHFHVGESITSEEALKRKFQHKGLTWYLTVLGSLATTQREYVALHAFQHLHSQMIKAILHPKPELFPKYDEEPPAMLDCFTQPFVQHLHKTFNGPQLAAIKWAAIHTAAGTTSSNGAGKRQDLWPFTLVQGPPGTGKTHTVWGMLNVIHLVQYQRYYAALLKKLAPDSLKAEEIVNDTGSVHSEGAGSIDDVLQKMDESLARILPKLCPKPRMLVCAPSNAATDEMLTRVLERGFIDGEMRVYRPDVARVGVDTQSRASQAVSVERRSDHLLGMTRDDVLGWLQQLRSRKAFMDQQIASLQKELSATAAAARSQGSVGVDPDVLAARDQTRDSKLQQLAAIVEEKDKVQVEMSRLFIVEGRFRGGQYLLEDARAKLEASFANEAEIVFTTVSSSGRRLFSHLAHGFDMVVIDEAAQASEVAVLPPLSLGAARCVLVGDPQQLPATVISRAAHTLQYSRSLFERFQLAGCPTMLLSVQYRMHPQIRDFPSRYFYQGHLVDSDNVTSLPDEAYHKDPLLKPYIFYDVSHGRESHKGNSVSYQNIPEAQFAAQLYEYLQNFIKTAGTGKVSVGVITPYKLQLKCLQQEFGSVLASDAESKAVYINTVDAFQGQERDVIIMSCVRASSHGVGFVADIRRMNVALTRARRSLWVVGNAAALVQSEDWAALIADAKERGCFVSMTASAVKNLLASTRTTITTAPSRASGLLRAPRPPPRLPSSIDDE